MTKLSIEALEYNMDKAEHVLQIKKLGVLSLVMAILGANTLQFEPTSLHRENSHCMGLTTYSVLMSTKDMSLQDS